MVCRYVFLHITASLVMFFLITNSNLLTLRIKTINYRILNDKGTVGGYIIDEIGNLFRISLPVDWQKQLPLNSGLLTITPAATADT